MRTSEMIRRLTKIMEREGDCDVMACGYDGNANMIHNDDAGSLMTMEGSCEMEDLYGITTKTFIVIASEGGGPRIGVGPVSRPRGVLGRLRAWWFGK